MRASHVPRPGLHPVPGSRPLTFEAAVLPPLIYYVALLFLAPLPPPAIFPIYSIGLTYQLGLVGLYGGCRVLDAFFISPYGFKHIPRRVKYVHKPRLETPVPDGREKIKEWSDGGVKEPYFHKAKGKANANPSADTKGQKSTQVKMAAGSGAADTKKGRTPGDTHRSTKASDTTAENIPDSAFESYFALQRTLSGPDPQPVLETATTEAGWPQSFQDRACWALELELSMRGVGFTWTTADVRHTRKTWLPTVSNRVHSILVHVLPVLLVSWFAIRNIYMRYLVEFADLPWDSEEAQSRELFDARLPLPIQLALTCALGAFLMAAFSLAHSLFAIMLSPLAPSPLAFFPPLYSTRIWDITSVRKFWSYGWHRLFARLFLVYGVWPGEWAERKITGKSDDEPADVGKTYPWGSTDSVLDMETSQVQ
ncbi:hypothetical protein DL765_008735 [Monosporascus sp. GIB2]|nr:hypothetical protein DL765_008735 [Monosporascus sp. GIB2]